MSSDESVPDVVGFESSAIGVELGGLLASAVDSTSDAVTTFQITTLTINIANKPPPITLTRIIMRRWALSADRDGFCHEAEPNVEAPEFEAVGHAVSLDANSSNAIESGAGETGDGESETTIDRPHDGQGKVCPIKAGSAWNCPPH